MPASAWPDEPEGQIKAARASVSRAAGSPAEAADRFAGAPLDSVKRYLELLAFLGHLQAHGAGRYHAVKEG